MFANLLSLLTVCTLRMPFLC
ncbi:hypothetical protein DF3PB_130023 [uncultured Defluviicoccus sp.]|uniref:Uncharacterized protein n=1 Tax=metagenome TaxID=256318 RepID=A0A380T8T4_9ZZZZ|nr:hypothetical protein DF3PB_130023 [uncultured Defluviicoccus sp.]